MGIPFWKGKLALVHTKRGWEMPGGHMEEGEDVQSCLDMMLDIKIGCGFFLC
jgi:hypothetical protein